MVVHTSLEDGEQMKLWQPMETEQPCTSERVAVEAGPQVKGYSEGRSESQADNREVKVYIRHSFASSSPSRQPLHLWAAQPAALTCGQNSPNPSQTRVWETVRLVS